MEKSNFKFSNPKLVKLDFEIKNGDNANISNDILNVSLNNNIDKKSTNEAVVELEIKIGEDSSEFPFFINLIIGAHFKLDGEIQGISFDKLLEINAPTVLLSYARPIISLITTQAGMKPLNLPFLNFTK
jgi:preprotein translocase subunit SecB